MPFETPITIKQAVENIHSKKYLLPAIQREFVWDDDQIERLFDSLMRDYPIGSFLFWKVTAEKSKEFQFYEFIREYHERDLSHNPQANINGENDITAILDGQQRLTALYIGLKGSYADKLPRFRWNNPDAFPQRKLYLNLTKSSHEGDLLYDFQFLTQAEKESANSDYYWFEVGKILDLKDMSSINRFLKDNLQAFTEDDCYAFAETALYKLFEAVQKNPVINFYLEQDEELDKVLNVFIRVNSGGTVLSYSDLLLSIATAEWKEQGGNAREVITHFVDEINAIGDGFNFSKDLVLKACLVLNDFSDIDFKADNFKQGNMLKIEQNWGKITQAIKRTIELLNYFGYSRDTLTSNNALIPIAYYLLKKESPKNFVEATQFESDRQGIQKWLVRSLLRGVFAGSSDTYLNSVRTIIRDSHASFPLEMITENFKGKPKSIIFSDDDIQRLFDYRYGQGYTFSVLALLYPTLDFSNHFHVDHIFPKSFFDRRALVKRGIGQEKLDFYMENYNYLANLQLLGGISNTQKSNKDFQVWLKQQCPDETAMKEYMNKHYIPDTDFSLDNFEQFIAKRKQLITEKLQGLLK